MESKKDSPGVYIPPPLFYVLIFLTAVLIQKKFSIDNAVFHLQIMKVAGIVLLAVALFFLVTSFKKFFQSKNTLIPIKPAASLQTNGIYNISRNPMYAGLAMMYLGITCFVGNWWNIILFPLLIVIVQAYIITREEQYLTRRFGQVYLDYKTKVRRWL
jgi:protein-S-isoprenylcysteine O-methyltransferase Ste14